MKMRHHSKLTVSRRLELYKPMGVSRHKRRVRPGFHHDKALVAAVLQLLCGLGALTLGTVSILTHTWGYYFGSGFWAGAFFLAAGISGLAAGIRKNTTPITTSIVFSAIAFMLAVVMLALAAIGISPNHSFYTEEHADGASVVILSLYVATATIEIFAALVNTAICFKALCMAPHCDRQYEIAVQSPVSSEFGPQNAPARHNSYGHYELCSDMDTEFSVSEGLTPLAPSSQLPTTCTEELPILSSVLENNITPDDATCLLHNDPTTVLDSPARSSITAQEENEVNDLLENSPDVAPPGTPPPSYNQVSKVGSKNSRPAAAKGKTTANKTRPETMSQRKSIPPIAKPPSGPSRSGMKKSASQTSNKSMKSSSSQQGLTSRHSSASLRSESSSSVQQATSPSKHKRPSHLDIPPKGVSSRTRGQVRQRSSRSSTTATASNTAAKPARGSSSTQRGARTPSRTGSQTSTTSLQSRGSIRSQTSKPAPQKTNPISQKTSQKPSDTKNAQSSTKGQAPPRPVASQRSRPQGQGSQPSTGAARARNSTTRSDNTSNPPQRSPLDTLL